MEDFVCGRKGVALAQAARDVVACKSPSLNVCWSIMCSKISYDANGAGFFGTFQGKNSVLRTIGTSIMNCAPCRLVQLLFHSCGHPSGAHMGDVEKGSVEYEDHEWLTAAKLPLWQNAREHLVSHFVDFHIRNNIR